MTVKRYTDLIAGRKAMDLVEPVYRITTSFPKEEIYGLSSQVRKAAVSIPSNVAEGHCRNGRREFVHHLPIALGSLGEVETQMLIGARLGYVAAPDLEVFSKAAGESGRLLVGLMNSLERHAAAS